MPGGGDFALNRSSRPGRGPRPQPRGYTDLSATYTKTYKTTHLTQSRSRFSSHGYRVAINAESTVSAAFTGSLTNTSKAPSPLTAPLFQAYIRYYNVQLSTHKHVRTTTAMTLPWSTVGGTGGGPDYYVPIPLSGAVSLAPGIYQFDVYVTLVALSGPPAVLSDSESDSDDSGSDSDGSSVVAPATAFTVDGAGTLSIQIVRKTL